MNKNIIQRILAGVLAAVMLVSTMGLSIDMHYCGGKLKSYSLFGDAESCYAKGDMVCYAHAADGSHDNQHANLNKKKCCENRQVIVQPVENLNIPVFKNSLDDNRNSSAIAVIRNTDLPAMIPVKTCLEFDYRPPLLVRTTPVLLQSFLI